MKNLTEKALIVTLAISQWSARKYDRKISKEVDQTHNATDAGRYNKILIAKTHLEEIQKTVSAVRDFHYKNTLPWSDLGERILPTVNYFEYTAKIREFRTDFEKNVRSLVQVYPSLIDEAKIKLNGLFNALDYPKDISSKFDLKVGFMPLPEASDFRVDLNKDEVNNLRESIEGEINSRVQDAVRDIYTRVKSQLEHMRERLSEKDAVFRDTLFTNMEELVKLMPKLNLTNDPTIDALAEDLKNLCAVSIPDVRLNKKLRADKANEVSSILQNMGAFFQPVSV